jgi:hypothetical protein
MGADLGVPDADKRSDKDADWRYWWCYWMTFIVLISLSMRFVVGSAAHSSGFHDKPVEICGFVRDLVFLVVFGILLVEAALARRHWYFISWLMGFSAAGFLVGLCEGGGWGQLWVRTHGWSFVVTLVCWFLVPKQRSTLADRRYVRKLMAVLTPLAAFYGGIFVYDIRHLLLNAS